MTTLENSNSMQRVKVYRLNEDGKWDDRGTGHVTMDYMEQSEDLGLYVIDEDDHETLLVHRISTEDIYKKQEDTIISWRDPELSTELALSFQETAGCSYVWNQISTMQQNLHLSSLNNETFNNVNSESRELPDVNLSNLPVILKIVTTDQMRLTELMSKDLDFFRNLMDVFKICEDSKNIDGLHMMFNIVKGIISLNNSKIMQKILGDELIMEIIGCLEYDPHVPQSQHYRNYLKEHVVFKEALPIKDPLVLSKIHQTYRIGYLKDVALTRVLDDAMAANLNSVIHANSAAIVTRLKDDSTFIQELFARLRSPSTSVESMNNLVHFLQEFCSLSKSLQVPEQQRFLRDLINRGIFDIIAEVLRSSDKKIVVTGADILLIFLTQDPNLLPSYIVRPEGTPLLGLLVKGMAEDLGDKMHCQFTEIVQTLLHSNALSGGAQRANIKDTFYEKHLPELVDVITASCPERPGNTSEGASRRVGIYCKAKPEVILKICDFLCFCVRQDSSRTRTNFLHKNVTEKVLHLTRRKETYIVVAAIRFFRTLLSVLDDSDQSYIVTKNMLKPIMDVFVGNGKRYNLLHSAVLELLEHIRKLNATVLLKYVVDTFWDQLAPFECLTSIQDLKTKYEQCLESRGPKSTTDLRGNEGALDNDVKENGDGEHSASVTDDQKEEAASSASLSLGFRGLVDYEDDEDDDDCKASEEEKKGPLGVKNKSPCRENEQERSKRARLCSTTEGNNKSPEPDKSSSDSKHGTVDNGKLKGDDDESGLEPHS